MFQLYSDSRHLYWNTQVFERPPLIMCNNLKRLEISFNDEHPIVSLIFLLNDIFKQVLLLIFVDEPSDSYQVHRQMFKTTTFGAIRQMELG